jgi:hypothetical protein
VVRRGCKRPKNCGAQLNNLGEIVEVTRLKGGVLDVVGNLRDRASIALRAGPFLGGSLFPNPLSQGDPLAISSSAGQASFDFS